MTPFTLVMAYYENPGMLQHQVRAWRMLPAEIRAHLHVVIVDDGSPNHPALGAVTAGDLAGWTDELADVQLWRMGVDVRWNQDACRNIGAREATTPWLMLTDMDHVVPAQTWEWLMASKLNKHSIYRFARRSAPDLSKYKHHPNTWAMTRKKFWQIGGYDEALAGNYGTDGDFLVRAQRVSPIEDVAAWIVRYPREVIADASTTTLTRKSLEDKDRIRQLIRGRTADWRPRNFRFPCERQL